MLIQENIANKSQKSGIFSSRIDMLCDGESSQYIALVENISLNNSCFLRIIDCHLFSQLCALEMDYQIQNICMSTNAEFAICCTNEIPCHFNIIDIKQCSLLLNIKCRDNPFKLIHCYSNHITIIWISVSSTRVTLCTYHKHTNACDVK